jgi:hypothetical protein
VNTLFEKTFTYDEVKVEFYTEKDSIRPMGSLNSIPVDRPAVRLNGVGGQIMQARIVCGAPDTWEANAKAWIDQCHKTGENLNR